MALRANSIYAYVDLDDNQLFVKTADLNDRGAWSSVTSYVFRDAALYNGAYYAALVANSNVPPSGNVSDEWSVLVIVRSGSDTGHTADEAYNLAANALDTATTAENTAEQALALAMTGGTTGQSGSAYAFGLFLSGTNYTNGQVSIEATARAAGDTAEANARVFGDGTVAQQGSNYAHDLYVAGTNYANSIAVSGGTGISQAGSAYAFGLYTTGTNYTNTQVAVEASTRAAHDLVEAAARVFGDGTTLAAAMAYADSLSGGGSSGTVGQAGSAYAFGLYVTGTNYTNSQFTAEATTRANAVTAEAQARVFGDGTVAQQGSNFSYGLYVAGTNYAQSLSTGASVAQQGSQYSTILRDQGTNFTISQVATAVHTGSEYAYDLYLQGTTYAASLSSNNQAGSQYSHILFDQGTNYTNTQVTTAVHTGSEYAYDLFLQGTAYAASLAQNNQSGSQYSHILFDQGTNYTNGQVTAAVHTGSEYAYDLFLFGTNYTNGQVSAAVLTGSAYAFSLYTTGTNYTNTQVSAEAVLRAAADSLIRSDGTIFTVTQVGAEATSRIAGDLLVAQQGSQYSTILRDQGTNYTLSQVAVEVSNRQVAIQAEASARVFGDGTVAQYGSQYAHILFDQGTVYTQQQIALAVLSSGSSSLSLYWAGTDYTNAAVAAEAVIRANADSAEAITRANADSAESVARIAGDATNSAAISALQAILGISLTGTTSYYMAQVGRGKPDTKLTIINGVVTGVVQSPFVWDDFASYSVGTYAGSVTVPVSITGGQINKGSSWLSNGSVAMDIFTGTVAQDPLNAYSLGTISALSLGYGWATNGTFATPYVNQIGVDLFETYSIGTVNNSNPINDGTYFTQPAVLFSW